MRSTEVVYISLTKSCDFTLPTISSDSTFGDTMTYVKGYSPVTLTFSGFTATCSFSRNVVHSDGAALNFYQTYTQGASSDILTFSTSNPALEGTQYLKFIMTSSEASELI